MQNRNRQRITIIFGVVMLVAMSASVFMPLLSQNLQSQALPTVASTPTIAPTPLPTPDVAAMSFDQTYLHPSGLFTIAKPVDWAVSESTNDDTQVRVTMINAPASSVIEASVEQPVTPITTLDQLSERYTAAVLDESWSNYGQWRETTTLPRPQRDGKLIMDFELGFGAQTLLARHVSWIQGDWIYTVRVVMPSNARDALLAMLDKISPTLALNETVVGTPLSWKAYFDTLDKHIIRFPSTWRVTDSAPGLPASIQQGNNSLRVSTEEGAVADETAARAWLETSRPGANILSVQPVERNGSTGFSLAYSLIDAEGENISGLAVVLNGVDNKLHVANIRFPASQVNLNALPQEPNPQYTHLAQIMGTFQLEPELNVTITDLSVQG